MGPKPPLAFVCSGPPRCLIRSHSGLYHVNGLQQISRFSLYSKIADYVKNVKTLRYLFEPGTPVLLSFKFICFEKSVDNLDSKTVKSKSANHEELQLLCNKQNEIICLTRRKLVGSCFFFVLHHQLNKTVGIFSYANGYNYKSFAPS